MVETWQVMAVGMVVCAAASFFFALAETSLMAVGRWRAQRMREAGHERGKLVAELIEEGSDLVGALAFGNTFANAALVGLGGWGTLRYGFSPWITLPGLLLVILIGCEMVPKILAVRAPEFWSLRLAQATHWWVALSGPFRKGAQWMVRWLVQIMTPRSFKPHVAISEEEYQELLQMATEQGALQQGEQEIILQILSLDQRTASDVMRARSQLALLSDELSKEEMIEIARTSKHSRIPIYDETPDTIVGVLNARALLLDPSLELEEVIEFPSFVPASMNLLLLLRSLQRQRRGLAIVLDEFGGTAGVVSMEDILRDTLGPLRPGHDNSGFIMEKLAPGKWRVSGFCRVDQFRREEPDIGEEDDVTTMGGLALKLFETIPGPNESVTWRGYRFTARVVEDRRIRELLIEKGRR